MRATVVIGHPLDSCRVSQRHGELERCVDTQLSKQMRIACKGMNLFETIALDGGGAVVHAINVTACLLLVAPHKNLVRHNRGHMTTRPQKDHYEQYIPRKRGERKHTCCLADERGQHTARKDKGKISYFIWECVLLRAKKQY